MSLEKCANCGNEFLSEADDYAVIPKNNYSLICYRCFSFHYESALLKDQLAQEKQKSKELIECLKKLELQGNYSLAQGLIRQCLEKWRDK